MKLCVLTKRIQEEPLYQRDGVFLYNLSLDEYKKCILKGIVSTDINHNAIICYRYAEESLCRFEHGEVYISKSAQSSYYYAVNVLEDIFILGEEAISKSDWCSYLYANEVLKSRFILGEEVISFDGYYSYYYAVIVLKERFILGEQAIKKSGHRKEYEQYFNITLWYILVKSV